MKNTINKNDINIQIEQTYLNESYLPDHEAKSLKKNPGYVENPNSYRIYPFKDEHTHQIKFTNNPKAAKNYVGTYLHTSKGEYKFVMTGVIDENGQPQHVSYYADKNDAGYQRTSEDKPYVKNHNDFIHGRPVLLAGTLSINASGELTFISNESGHYRVNRKNFLAVSKYIIDQLDRSGLTLHDYSLATQKPAAYYRIHLLNDDKFGANTKFMNEILDTKKNLANDNMDEKNENDGNLCYESILTTANPPVVSALNFNDIGDPILLDTQSRVQNGTPLQKSLETDDLKLLIMIKNKTRDDMKSSSHDRLSHLLIQSPVLKPVSKTTIIMQDKKNIDAPFSFTEAKNHLKKLTIPSFFSQNSLKIKTKGLSVSTLLYHTDNDLNKEIPLSKLSENTNTNLLLKQDDTSTKRLDAK